MTFPSLFGVIPKSLIEIAFSIAWRHDWSKGWIDIVWESTVDIFASDFIVAYPEETDVDFKDTMDLINEVGFTNSFSYIFSPRPGTVASNLRQIDKDKAKERLKIIQDKLFYFQNEKNKKYINKTIDVLVENKTKVNNQYFGRAEDITPVFVDCNENITGETIKVNITKTNKVNLFGSMVL